MSEKYCVEIGEKGSEGLGRLEYCFNATTQNFLMQAGLKSGMNVLDIGCGSGVMTCWIAKQVGERGKVIGIENNEHQLQAAIRESLRQSIHNIEFKLCSAYEIDTLNEKFDLIYCRFVLHHLHDPMSVIHKIFDLLKPNGIYCAEEGIVNYTFSYPFSSAWGDESLRVPPVWLDAPKDQRDGNFGIKLYNKMHTVGFNLIYTKIIHPLLTTREEKKLLLLGREEEKKYFLEQGGTEGEWLALGKKIESIINNDAQIVGFYGSCQVAGVK